MEGKRNRSWPVSRHSNRVGKYSVQLPSLYLLYWKKVFVLRRKNSLRSRSIADISGKLDSSQEESKDQNLNGSLLNRAFPVKLQSLRWKVFNISTKIGKYGLCASAQRSLCFRATTQGHNHELSTFCPFKGWRLEFFWSRNKKLPPHHQKNVSE